MIYYSKLLNDDLRYYLELSYCIPFTLYYIQTNQENKEMNGRKNPRDSLSRSSSNNKNSIEVKTNTFLKLTSQIYSLMNSQSVKNIFIEELGLSFLIMMNLLTPYAYYYNKYSPVNY